jgi:GGDEF domain-containing protein
VLRIRASVGCAVYPHDAPDAAALLRRADAAMYGVKRSNALAEGA